MGPVSFHRRTGDLFAVSKLPCRRGGGSESFMYFKSEGIVLREVLIDEADKLLDILTK